MNVKFAENSALKIRTSICKKTYIHSKNKKAMEIMFCKCNENQGVEVQCEICHSTIKLKISSCANVVYNDIVDKNFRLCRCRTLKSSCTNIVKLGCASVVYNDILAKTSGCAGVKP